MLLNFIFGKNVRLDYTHHVLHSLKLFLAGGICLFSYRSRINNIEFQFFGFSKGIFQKHDIQSISIINHFKTCFSKFLIAI